MEKQEELMLTRRQKTLSSISNFVPLNIILNQPIGVSFTLTVPKSFTIEQLARQIEAEYAFLVEREVGDTRYPVIECGALFDHVELKSKGRNRRGIKSGSKDKNLDGEEGNQDYYDDDDDEEEIIDEREEAESRGVQLRFSDRVEDVLDRDSTVHVVNIDQGLGKGRALSLTNLALVVGHEDILSDNDTSPEILSTLSFTNNNNVLATAATSLTPSPPTSGDNSPHTGSDARRLSSSSLVVEPPNISFEDPREKMIRQGPKPRTSIMTTDTATTLLASSFVSSASLSSILHGDIHAAQSRSSAGTAAATTAESWRPLSICSVATEATVSTTTTGILNSSSSCSNSSKPLPFRPRSRATDILLNLEASSNDARFQEILHNSIALDHFRQFCFQEYSIENLLFWMDVELFAKPSEELLQIGGSKSKNQEYRQHLDEKNCYNDSDDSDDSSDNDDENDDGHTKMNAEQFAVQHARYIYLTYIDPCGPLQVNLSEESRTDIPWPILDPRPEDASTPSSVNSSPCAEKKKSAPWSLGGSREQKKTDEIVGWPLDRHMFDGAQEHTYQLMKGHTLVRFEESDLWKAVKKIMVEQPETYAKAAIRGSLNSYYKPNVSVILKTVTRSRSRHPSAKPSVLYNWNNSTSDLDRSRDKEEALAKAMSQYFGPIPPSLRHKGRVILGLGNPEDDSEDGFEDFDYGINRHIGAAPIRNSRGDDNKRLSTSSVGNKKSRFVKHLSGGITSVIGKSMSNASDDMMDLYHDDTTNYLSEIDSVENGKRTTRWMVAGYFNDKVRLTAAQRKRLLRRNNKLTKFFGSRVDGTLRPVEELVEGGLGFDQFGVSASKSSSAPTLGSPLAYALSSSTIHDMDKKSKTKTNKRNIMGNTGNGSEVLLLLPGSQGSGSRSSNLLQKFKKNSSEFEDSNYRTINSSATPFQFAENPRSLSNPRGFFNRRSNDDKGGNERHYRSMTTDVHHPSRILAHPHPLWSGSLSDQEGVASTTYERRRGLSIMSLMGNSTPGAMPTTPTSVMPGLFGSYRGADQDGSLSKAVGDSLDRLDMSTRRKKADKLSTFFGAQLTTLELASQLPMENEDGAVPDISNYRSSLETHVLKVDRPTVSSVNQLSKKERSILWKRNKKLRGILGEALPESAVALALTRPVLMGVPKLKIADPSSGTSRRSGTSSKVARRRRPGSLHSRNSYRQQEGDEQDAESNQSESDGSEVGEEYVDEETTKDDNDFRSSSASITKSIIKGKGRVAKRAVSARTRRASNVSASSRKSQTRLSRNSSAGLNQPHDSKSVESVLNMDSLLGSTIVDDSEDEVEQGIGGYDGLDREVSHVSSGSPKPRRRKNNRTNALNVNTLVSGSRSSSEITMSRFHRKKRMDKIQQFLGDRVPEQDLWMGAVGREKTQEMLDLNLFSPSSSTGSGPPSSVRRHGFPVSRSKSKSTGNVITDLRASTSNASSGPMVERLLTDPQSRHSEEQLQQQQQQHQAAQHSTTSRLRQQLASPASSTSSQASSASGNGQLLVGTNEFSSPTASGPASPTVVATLSPVSMTGLSTPLALLQEDDEDPSDESAEILPKLRAMSGKDQERFLKRAEKLEKYFGQFPPSALLLDNNNSNCISPTREFEEGFVINGTDTASTSGKRSVSEHVGLFSNGNSRRNSASNASSVRKNEKEKRFSGSLRKQQSPGRSSVDTIESLVVSETQFRCEL
ncbi:hypothetical protein BGX27_008346 [Mortierella sp. AM989]|nr:hypothetical protein BGX27_008346 [Mortierella sp. AM989]